MGNKIGGLVAAAVVLLGSFLPWASVSAFGYSATVNGMDGDGAITLVGALAMGVLFGLWKRGTVIAAAVVSVLVFLVGVIDMVDIQRTIGGDDFSGLVDGSASIGLYMVVLGGLAGIVLALIGQAGIKTAPPAFGVMPYGAAQAPAWGQAPAQAAPAWGQAPAQAAPAWGQAPAQAAPAWGQAPAQAAPAWGQAPQQYAAPAQMPVQQAPAQAPAGWLPDPYGQAQLRYWDGVRWTEHTHNQ